MALAADQSNRIELISQPTSSDGQEWAIAKKEDLNNKSDPEDSVRLDLSTCLGWDHPCREIC